MGRARASGWDGGSARAPARNGAPARAYGEEVGQLPESGLPFNLEDLLHARTIESQRLEFKATWAGPTKAQVVRTVCAFANDMQNINGGYIVLGIVAPDCQPAARR